MLSRLAILVMILAALGSCGKRRKAAPPIPAGLVELCGNPLLAGVERDRITESNPACGIKNPVEILYVAGVEMTPHPVLNCTTANALATWVDSAAKPDVAAIGRRLAKLRVGSHYACRTRNSVRGARLSEHATGNAVDITAFTLDSGEVYTIKDGWNSPVFGKVMQKAYAQACGIFGTTLGPNADRNHLDNLHFDVASYRGGPYCR